MSDQLINHDHGEAQAHGAERATRSSRWHAVGLVLAIVVLSGAAAALGGWWWWRWWSPAPAGTIGQDQSTGEFGWYPKSFELGQAHMASSTFQYVVVGFVLAAIVGLATSFLGRNRPLLALSTLGGASVAASAVMAIVGRALGPSDPSTWANASHVGEEHPGWLTIGHADLRVWSWLSDLLHLSRGRIPIPTPLLVWPMAALLVFGLVMLMAPPLRPVATPATSDSGPGDLSQDDESLQTHG